VKGGIYVHPHTNTRSVCHRDYAPWHARLLAEERETHRIALDRQQQRTARLQQRWRQECAAHTQTRLLLLQSQIQLCESREEAGRQGITRAAMEEQCQLQQAWITLMHLFTLTGQRTAARRDLHKQPFSHSHSNSNSELSPWLPAALLPHQQRP
ncbi:uncharacterized protein TM35_000101920, partial [Trypanosoma theileri]